MFWENEGDRFAFEANGYKCLILRHPSIKHLCGYIGVPKELSVDSYDEFPPEVHGGWTYGETAAPNEPEDGLYWYGFDCAHAGDLVPGITLSRMRDDVYRDVTFVRSELERVANELPTPSSTSAKETEYER